MASNQKHAIENQVIQTSSLNTPACTHKWHKIKTEVKLYTKINLKVKHTYQYK